jgi:glycosyltransferase involved in cell wall biosynthesis
MGGQGARELERVAFAPTEQALRAEERWCHVNDPDVTVSCITLGDPQRLTGGYLYHLRMAEMASSHGARWAFVSIPDRPFVLGIAAGRRVLAEAAAQHPDVILLDSIAAAMVAPWLAVRPTPAPMVAILHQTPGGIDHGRLRTRVQALLDLTAYRRVERVLVASDALAADATRAGVPAGDMLVVAPGRDVAAAPAEPPADLRDGRRAALLCVANWIARKGILELLAAVERLPADAATLHLVGDDRADPRYRAAVLERLARPELTGRVVVHGPVSREQVAAFYRAADVFVLPSTVEPYGTVYGEAMAAGLPAVGWDAGNLPNLARDGAEGLVVPTGDVPALASALRELIDDDDRRRRMADAARRRAASFPTWEDSAALLFGALREAAAPRHPTSRRP